MSAPVVVVIGKGVGCPPVVEQWAEEAGQVVARLGGVLVTGGLGGAMAGAARGAVAEGGTAVGLCPLGRDRDIWDEDGVIVLRTGLPVPYRNALTASVADAAIAVAGSHGTVQEGMILAERGVPLIGYGAHGGFPSAILADEFVDATTDQATLALILAEQVERELVA